MPKIILVHSFRHGVGRSTLTANLGYLLAVAGRRVGLIDGDTVSPALNLFFNVPDSELVCTYADVLLGRCSIDRAAIPLAPRLEGPLAGELFFVPGRIAASPPDTNTYLAQLDRSCRLLTEFFGLDMLIIDTQPGLSRSALVSLILPDVLVIVLRHDWRDYQGTGVTIDVVRQLNVPRVALVINEVPAHFDLAAMKTELVQTYQCDVLALLPHLDEMVTLPDPKIFAMHYPHHPVAAMLQQAALSLVAQDNGV